MNERDKELASQGAALHGHTLKFTPEILAVLGSFADLIRADEREKVLAGERIRIKQRLETLKTAIALLKAENAELKDELKVRGNT